MIYVEGAATTTILPTLIPSTLEEIFDRWGETWFLKYFNITDNGIWLTKALINDAAILVYNGSYQPHVTTTRGSTAWIIECTTTKLRCTGMAESPTSIANAYRSELTGLYAVLAVILLVTILHDIKEGKLRVGCDNEKGLYLSSLISLKIPIKTKHADILRCIRLVRTALPLDITFAHIKAHQDDSILYHLLDRM